jgi:hypothetical protein
MSGWWVIPRPPYTCARRAIAVLCAAVMQFRQQQHQLIVVASGDRVVLPGA